APKESGGAEGPPPGSAAPAWPEREARAEEELRELKAQLEEAGFSSVSHIRQEPGAPELAGGGGWRQEPPRAMLSLCLENAELKERMGEATSLLDSGEQEEAGAGSPLTPEPRRLQRKGRGTLGDCPASATARADQGLPAERGAVPAKRPALEARSWDDAPKRPCPSSPGGAEGSHVSDAGGLASMRMGARAGAHSASPLRQAKLQAKLAASEATVRAQAAQLQKYHALLREPHAQQLSKQVQVDCQDLGYETCGRSETEAEREETTSPGKRCQGLCAPCALPARHAAVTPFPIRSTECEEPDVFSEPSLGDELGSPRRLGAATAALEAVPPPDVGALHQHIRHLKAQLLNANKVIQSLQRRVRSVSHLRDALRAFEELLRGTDIDYYLGQGFREQLAQGRQLAERLGDKLTPRDWQDGEDKSSHELLVLRLSRELQEKEKVIESLEAKLQERCESPGSSRAPSESSRSITSTSFVSDGLEPCSDGDAASECSQCREEPARGAGLRFDSLPKADSAPLPALLPGLPPFLPTGAPPPAAPALLGCCGPPVCSLAEAQQELQVLRRQLGESAPLPAKPPAPPGPFGEGSKPPGSLCRHGAPQGPAQAPAAAKPRVLWDAPPLHGPLCGAVASQKLTGADLLEEHLLEIRSLRQRLEESICTNDRLREQLERRLASTGKAGGFSTDAYSQGQELGARPGSETRALREENGALRLQRDHLSQELALAQEALLAARARAREAEAEAGRRRGEQRGLADELAKCQESARQLRDERRSLHEDNNRLQHTVTLLQQQCEEQRVLLQALHAELRGHETLPGPAGQPRAGCFPSPPVRDVGTSSAGPFSPTPPGTAVARQLDEPRGADPPAGKREGLTGAHVVGRLDTYRALEQRVAEGKALARELVCLTCPAPQLHHRPPAGKE
ncbi:MYOME protein, partial [Nothocercus nigrocapillus]|nr:MYOME protein [Nothocercus nigrocapillus]